MDTSYFTYSEKSIPSYVLKKCSKEELQLLQRISVNFNFLKSKKKKKLANISENQEENMEKIRENGIFCFEILKRKNLLISYVAIDVNL